MPTARSRHQMSTLFTVWRHLGDVITWRREGGRSDLNDILEGTDAVKFVCHNLCKQWVYTGSAVNLDQPRWGTEARNRSEEESTVRRRRRRDAKTVDLAILSSVVYCTIRRRRHGAPFRSVASLVASSFHQWTSVGRLYRRHQHQPQNRKPPSATVGTSTSQPHCSSHALSLVKLLVVISVPVPLIVFCLHYHFICLQYIYLIFYSSTRFQ